MKALKRIAAVLLCLLLITVSFSAFAEGKQPKVIYSTFNVTLHHNINLSRYGVTVYFDGIQVARLEQGDIATFGAYMTDDRVHEIRFVPDKAGVPDRVWTLSNLQHGTALVCEIQTKRNQVKVRSMDMRVGGTDVFSISPDMEKQVKVLGTIVVTGLGVYKSASGLVGN